ncbi:hypothetical protein FOA52_013873 [Chlamydomonas sp. UWO 241]|nr:hypothetical protein FOA52_013873 [Chlamydomonas sp. UWO 241]
MPGLSTNTFLERLHEGSRAVASAHGAHLRLDPVAAQQLAQALAGRTDEVRAAHMRHLVMPIKFQSVEAEVTFLALYHMLAMGSGWDKELRATSRRGAIETMQFAVLGMHISGAGMDQAWMSAFSNLQVQNFFGLETHVDTPVPNLPGVTMSKPGPLLPLARALQEMMAETGAALDAEGATTLGGYILTQLADQTAGGRPPLAGAFVEELCSSLPGFADAGLYEGQTITYGRKAQALAGALHARFGTSDPRFAFADATSLCGDSGPAAVAALRSAGVLVVSGELADMLDAGTELPPGPHERALRCAAVAGADAVAAAAGGAFIAAELGAYLCALALDEGETAGEKQRAAGLAPILCCPHLPHKMCSQVKSANPLGIACTLFANRAVARRFISMKQLKSLARGVFSNADASPSRSVSEVQAVAREEQSAPPSGEPSPQVVAAPSATQSESRRNEGVKEEAEQEIVAEPTEPDRSSAPAAPSSFYCPVSMELMADPVMVATGHTYDRMCIERWISQGNRTCPLTGKRLRHVELTPNHALRNAIQEWAAQHGVALGSVSATTAAGPVEQEVEPPSILLGHDEIVWSVEVYGSRLLSASADKTIRVWDVASRRCEKVLEEHTRPVLSLAISNGRLYSGSYDYSIKVWDLDSLTRIRTLTGHTDAVRALAVSGGKLFSGSYDGTVRVWDESRMQCVEVLKGHIGPVRTLVACNGLMFSGSYDKTVRVWDVAALEPKACLTGHTSAVRALVASATRVFSGSDDATIKVWDAETLQCLKTLTGHEDNVRVLAVSDRFLFSGSWDKTIRVWDVNTLECVHVLEGHSEAVLALTVAGNGATLVSGSYDTTVRFWDLSTFRCLRKCDGHSDAVRVLAAAGGNVFSGAYDGSIGVWATAS